MRRHVPSALLLAPALLIAALPSRSGGQATQKSQGPTTKPDAATKPDSPVKPDTVSAQQFREAVAAARRVRDEKVRAADTVFRATADNALAAFKDQRRRRLDQLAATHDARIKEITKSGDLDRALAAREAKDKAVREAREDDARLVKEFEALAALPATPDDSPANRPAAGTLGAAPPAAVVAPAGNVEELTRALRQRIDRRLTGAAALPTGQVDGEATWAGGAFTLDGVVQVGNSDKNHPGPWSSAKVAAEPGFTLAGGTLRASGGSIRLRGTPQNPIVLRGVRVECEYTAKVVAEHAVFVDCTFAKTGGFHWNDGYSSKWELTNCLMVNTSFAKLTRMDYGLKLNRCTFVGGRLPPRTWGYKKTEGPDDDGAKLARGEWSTVANCDFYDCEVAASAAWVTQGCDFLRCRVKEPGTFQSKTDLEVEVGAWADDGFVRDLTAGTTSGGSGKVRYARRDPAAWVAARSPLWQAVAAAPPPGTAAPAAVPPTAGPTGETSRPPASPPATQPKPSGPTTEPKGRGLFD